MVIIIYVKNCIFEQKNDRIFPVTGPPWRPLLSLPQRSWLERGSEIQTLPGYDSVTCDIFLQIRYEILKQWVLCPDFCALMFEP